MRALLFLGLCIPARLAVAAFASRTKSLRALGVVGLVIASGFFLIWATGSRTHGVETFGEPIWWNDLRPVHAALWGSFGLLAVQNVQPSYQLLVVDAAVGLIAWANQLHF